MTSAHSPQQQRPPRHRRRGLFLPLVALALLAAGWSAYWLFAARTAERLADAWLEREQQRGRVYSCEERSISGYPFRIEIDCRSPSLVAGPRGQQMRYAADRLLGVAQIYNFKHIIAEVTGPVVVAPADKPNEPVMRLDWSLAQASVIIGPDELQQLDIAIDAMETWIADKEGLDEASLPLVTAKRLEAHSRLKPGGTPAARDYDVAFKLRDASVRGDSDVLASPVSQLPAVDLAGTIFALPQGLGDDIRANLRSWQANGGRFELSGLRADTGVALGLAKGTLELTAAGQLNGRITLTVAGAESLSGNGQSGTAGMVVGALGMIGKSVTMDGRKAVEIPVRISDGAVGAGPLSLLQIPPLF